MQEYCGSNGTQEVCCQECRKHARLTGAKNPQELCQQCAQLVSRWHCHGKQSWGVVVVLVAQSCLTLCDPKDCSPPGSSLHGILQARILEWVAIPFSGGSSQPRDQTQVFFTAGGFFTAWATSEALRRVYSTLNKIQMIKDYLGFYPKILYCLVVKFLGWRQKKMIQNPHKPDSDLQGC